MKTHNSCFASSRLSSVTILAAAAATNLHSHSSQLNHRLCRRSARRWLAFLGFEKAFQKWKCPSDLSLAFREAWSSQSWRRTAYRRTRSSSKTSFLLFIPLLALLPPLPPHLSSKLPLERKWHQFWTGRGRCLTLHVWSWTIGLLRATKHSH